MEGIRPCRGDEIGEILAVVNAAAQRYRGAIPADCWHEPYMPLHELEGEVAAGVAFWGFEREGRLAGVMGVQPVKDVELIRHAYVRPADQRHGIGSALLAHVRSRGHRPRLIGTWADATWAIRFYQRNGFELVSEARKASLLRTYWTIPRRQAAVSVVLEEKA